MGGLICGLGLEIEIDPFQPLGCPCPLNFVHKDKECNKDMSKW